MACGQFLCRAGVLLGFLLTVAGAAMADGLFVKDRRFPVPPPIPAQRALVIHRDGVERLVVESSTDAEGQTLGWILPLPAHPTEVREATPGALDTLDLATRPRIESGGSWLAILLPAGLLFVLFTALRLHQARRRGTSILGRFETILVLLVLLGLLVIIAIPNLQAGKLGMPPVTVPGVTASDRQRVGNYEVTVLEARDGAALGAWLERNGLAAIPAAGKSIVDDHVAQGWVFVAARLVREGEGPAVPHPLSVVFPAEKPIYPMRLTALAGGTTALRIHVVAGGSASCDPLEVRFSGAFREEKDTQYGPLIGESGRALVFGGSMSGRQLAHPYLLEHLWGGCVVTRLEGTMTAGSMDRDLVFEVGETETCVHVVYTPAAAWREGFWRVLWIWALGMLVLVLLPDRVLPGLWATGSPFLRWVVVLAGFAGLAAAGVRASLPTIPEQGIVTASDPFRYGRPGWRLLQESDVHAGKPIAEVRSILEAKFRELALTSPYTGGPLRWGDSPGDVQLLEDHRGPVLRIWNLAGAPLDRAWFVERLYGALHEHRYRAAGGPTVEEARRVLFPGGVFAGDVRNPFTGAPLRESRDPGDAEIVEEGGKVVLRAWFREGKHMDIPWR